MGVPTGPRRADPRPLHDRLAFKPFAILLLIPVVLIASGLMAMVIAAPFVGAAVGVKRIDDKVTALGADFTKIPRFPERSTIYANDGKTVLATVYLDNREIVHLNKISPVARQAVLVHRGLGLLQPRRAQLDLAVAGGDRERPRRAGRRRRLDHHAAAREEHPGARSLRPELRTQAPGVRAGDPRREEVHEGPDPGDVPQPGVPGQRRLRDRDRRRVLLRGARLAGSRSRRAPRSRGSSATRASTTRSGTR